MRDHLRRYGSTLRERAKGFFSGPYFFIVLGCGFLYASYALLTKIGPCGVGESKLCLQLSQVHLAFGLVLALLSIALLLYGGALHAAQSGQLSDIGQVYNEVKSFFASPIFFILLGAFLIYCALTLLDTTHPGFVFILAILGISMMLFGTGSQAAASGQLPATGHLKIGIAGGAAALAAVFGYGTVLLSPGIQGFFKRTLDYGFLELTTSGSRSPNFDLDLHTVTATSPDGRPLHILKQTSSLQIMVPIYSHHRDSTVFVSVKGPFVPDGTPAATYSIDWSNVSPVSASAIEEIYVSRQQFNLPFPPSPSQDDQRRPVSGVTITPLDDQGRPASAVAITPQ
jgi:hypothetical protein